MAADDRSREAARANRAINVMTKFETLRRPAGQPRFSCRTLRAKFGGRRTHPATPDPDASRALPLLAVGIAARLTRFLGEGRRLLDTLLFLVVLSLRLLFL